MKRFLFALIIMSAGLQSVATAHCPTQEEYDAKMKSFSARVYALKPNPFFDYEAAEKLKVERQAFLDSVPVACVKYIKSTSTPDCEKVGNLAVWYAMMSRNKRASFAPQIRAIITPELSNRCYHEVDNLKDFLTVFENPSY